jgi:hypothetical protein
MCTQFAIGPSVIIHDSGGRGDVVRSDEKVANSPLPAGIDHRGPRPLYPFLLPKENKLLQKGTSLTLFFCEHKKYQRNKWHSPLLTNQKMSFTHSLASNRGKADGWLVVNIQRSRFKLCDMMTLHPVRASSDDICPLKPPLVVQP